MFRYRYAGFRGNVIRIDTGKAAAALARFVEVSQQAAEEFGH